MLSVTKFMTHIRRSHMATLPLPVCIRSFLPLGCKLIEVIAQPYKKQYTWKLLILGPYIHNTQVLMFHITVCVYSRIQRSWVLVGYTEYVIETQDIGHLHSINLFVQIPPFLPLFPETHSPLTVPCKQGLLFSRPHKTVYESRLPT